MVIMLLSQYKYIHLALLFAIDIMPKYRQYYIFSIEAAAVSFLWAMR